jgi:sugar phosphate isomerase/epimerase
MFSYQLYSSRNFPPLSATLQMLSAAGYGAVEGYGALYANDALVAELGTALAETGLMMPTGHFSLAMLEDEPVKVLGIAKSLNMQRLYCPYLMPDQRPTDAAGWKAFGARLEKAAKPYRAAGFGFGWHNHDFEFVPLPDGTIPQAAIFDGGPGLEWEIDVAWVIRGGADPIDWINRYATRITAAHVKDIAPAGENADEDGWADVGQGTVGWKAIMSALRAAGCTHFVMEHDNPSDHVRFATRSIKSAGRL